MLPLFRVILNAPDLRNANQGTNNYPFVDLLADQARIAIQVTVERSASKITETLEGFLKTDLSANYDRLIVFLLMPQIPAYQKATKQKWASLCKGKLYFDPARDIIAPVTLFPVIQALEQQQLEFVHGIVEKSVIGKNFIEVDEQLKNFSCRALTYESQTGKYIPDVFVETRNTKQLARLFCHPMRFFARHLESFSQLAVEEWNELLKKCGLAPLPIPDLSQISHWRTLEEAQEKASGVPIVFSDLKSCADKYRTGGRMEIPIESIPEPSRPFFEMNSWHLTNGGFGFSDGIDRFIEKADLVSKRIFILTGRAGQGKTNFLCDLTDTFLLRNDIPSAFISVRRLALQQGSSLGTTIAGQGSAYVFQHFRVIHGDEIFDASTRSNTIAVPGSEQNALEEF